MSKTAAQKTLAKAAKQADALRTMLDNARYVEGATDFEKGQMTWAMELLVRVESICNRGASPLPDAPSMTEQRLANLARMMEG